MTDGNESRAVFERVLEALTRAEGDDKALVADFTKLDGDTAGAVVDPCAPAGGRGVARDLHHGRRDAAGRGTGPASGPVALDQRRCAGGNRTRAQPGAAVRTAAGGAVFVNGP